MPKVRATSATLLPSFNMRSPSASFAITCSGVCFFLSCVFPPISILVGFLTFEVDQFLGAYQDILDQILKSISAQRAYLLFSMNAMFLVTLALFVLEVSRATKCSMSRVKRDSTAGRANGTDAV